MSETRKELLGEGKVVQERPGGLRVMWIVTSNAYRDREGEIVSQKALEGYVESCWKEGDFVGTNPLLVWHAGDAIGDIVFADMRGPFLIEIAQERPNTIVNLAADGEPPIYAEIKAVWDALEQEPDLGASHQFYYLTSDRDDRIYDVIKKTETSTLPRQAAANLFTDGMVIRSEA